ncbi:chemotaxis response regulator protein-glutamate methylesterase [Candidatus Methylospira mobilis]|uniref:Protein-glutamate methylesterase/protein-glutamine glutaminase n=1 Tax=Candidatus Methylospira mobilis TaxID=1808979 RepID=A0A5Q0BM48_9GAMM|nr:chemotaxis response regulator protein-glutamate methylesterase [Candidatus Methylospira mobilis]QFY43294.1 chemotaxis response regulator protein-glutamate methylesterase [Candidatus Methylospira mobilis]
MNITHKRRIRVLIVDDSALVRRILSDGIKRDPDLEVIGEASNPYAARDIMVENRPDVITLDVEMPKMDGVTFLKHYMPVMPIPTLMISSLTQQGQRITLDALESGAVDFIPKPQVGVVDELPKLQDEINRRIKAAAQISVAHLKRENRREVRAVTNLGNTTDRVIAIGSSTGGVEALTRILPAFPADAPGIVIVQHMPGGFTHSFAERLNELCRMQVKEAEEGDRVQPGRILLAPGGLKHMTVIRSGGQYRITLIDGDPVNYSRPSVDVLLNSVARAAGVNVAAAILTGMGKDGAEGLLAIRQAGGRTLAQDEETCVVFGMPSVAWAMGGAESLAPLENIPALLVNALQRRDN